MVLTMGHLMRNAIANCKLKNANCKFPAACLLVFFCPGYRLSNDATHQTSRMFRRVKFSFFIFQFAICGFSPGRSRRLLVPQEKRQTAESSVSLQQVAIKSKSLG